MNSLLPLYRAILSETNQFGLHPTSELFDYALAAGFGPLLHHVLDACESNPDSRRRMLGADMTARLLTGKQLDALDELAAAVSGSMSVTVLKGMSAALHYYPRPYMRTMGDIDLLVSPERQEELESLCLKLGYIRKSHLPESFYRDLHHSMPLYHPHNDVWIEVHTGLFPARSVAAGDYAFCPDNVFREAGRRVPGQPAITSLGLELELLYVCTHWGVEHNWLKAGLRILDVLFILNNKGSGLDWDKLFWWLDRSPAAANSLYVMVDFLKARSLVNLPDGILQRMAAASDGINRLNSYILHHLIESYTLQGRDFGTVLSHSNIDIIWSTLMYSRGSSLGKLLVRVPWNILFPPSSPNRYSLQFQWSRIQKLFGRF